MTLKAIAKGIHITAPGLGTSLRLTGYERSGDQTEAREIKDLKDTDCIKNYEAGETTPGTYTISFEGADENGGTTATGNAHIEVGTTGYLRVFTRDEEDDTWTLEKKIPVLLTEGPSQSATAKQYRTGTVKYQVRRNFTATMDPPDEEGSDTYIET